MLTPKEIVSYAAKSAITKGEYSFSKVGALSFLAGAYIAMGGLLAILAGYGFPGISAENPALVKLLMGAAFPVGIMLVVLAGAELFTGNTAYFIPAVLNKQTTWQKMLRNWTLVWLGNFVGALFFTYFLVHLTHVMHYEPWLAGIESIAKAKTSNPFYVTFLKGVGANWFVCLAMWLGMSATSTGGKIIALWWPVMAFVAIGYEHSIANMFFLPLAMFNGFELSITDLFIKNLIPATLGNIVGGSLFVGVVYWYVFVSDTPLKKNEQEEYLKSHK